MIGEAKAVFVAWRREIDLPGVLRRTHPEESHLEGKRACNRIRNPASHERMLFQEVTMRAGFVWVFRSAFTMIVAAAISAGTIKAVASDGTSENPQIILVELFTSEGCSSCPPADALLRRVSGTRTASGQFILGISEHVTYWDSLGWSDPFASSIFTERQNAYSAAFHLEGVYTPQMVIDGAEQIVGSDQPGLALAIRHEEGVPPEVSLRILATTVTGNSLNVRFSAIGKDDRHRVEILAVIADDTDKSNVLHGENSGRTLAHTSVAILIRPIAKLHAEPEQQVQIVLPNSFQHQQGHHLILFAQISGNRRIVGADSKPI